jgi:hypothetical protein
LVADNGEETGEQSFVITVNTSNQAPEFTSEPILQGTVDENYVYNVTATDPDDDDLVITATTLPTWLDFEDHGDGTATLSGTPTATSFLGFRVILEVTDGMFNDIQDFRIPVGESNIVDFGQGTVQVYPNPASDNITIINSQNAYYEIFDITGKIVKKGMINNNNFNVNINDLMQGNIIIRIIAENEVAVIKISKI